MRRLLAAGWLLAAPLAAQQPSYLVWTDTSAAPPRAAFAVRDSLIARVARSGVRTGFTTGRMGDIPAFVLFYPRTFAAHRAAQDSLAVWQRARLVAYVEVNAAFDLPTPPRDTLAGPTGLPSWGLETIRADSAWAHGLRGQGVLVADLDTGADSTHPGLPTIRWGRNTAAFLGDGTAWGDHNPDCRGHGTHTAGTIAGATVGVAPAAGLAIFQVFPLTGACGSSTGAGIAALNAACDSGAVAANISIGYGASPSLSFAARRCKALGMATLIANGNSGAGLPNGPAQDTSALGIAAGTTAGLSYYSQRGPTTDAVLPGDGIYSTLPGGGYGTKSGTSMATPHATGSFAIVASAPFYQALRASDPAAFVDDATALFKATGDTVPVADAYGAKVWRLDRVARALTSPPPCLSRSALALAPGGTDSVLVGCAAGWVAWTGSPEVTIQRRGAYLVITALAAALPGRVAAIRVGAQ